VVRADATSIGALLAASLVLYLFRYGAASLILANTFFHSPATVNVQRKAAATHRAFSVQVLVKRGIHRHRQTQTLTTKGVLPQDNLCEVRKIQARKHRILGRASARMEDGLEDSNVGGLEHSELEVTALKKSERRGGRPGRGGGRGGGLGREVQISKALSRLLRHQAENAGIKLDDAGFAPLDRVVSFAYKACP
jgi:hypothetical protein